MMMGVYKMSSSVNSSGCILSFTTYLANVEIDSSLFKLLNNFFEAVTRAQKLISELFLLQKWRSRGALNGKFFVYSRLLLNLLVAIQIGKGNCRN